MNAASLRCWHQPVWVSQEAAEHEIEFRAAARRRGHVLLIYSYDAGVGSASARKGAFNTPLQVVV